MCLDVIDAQIAGIDEVFPPRSSSGGPALCQPRLTHQAQKSIGQEISFIESPEFHKGTVEIPTLPSSTRQRSEPRNPPMGCRNVSDYFNTLARTPLLNAAEEKAAFRGMNYLKYRANMLRGPISLDHPQETLAKEIDRLLDAALALRNQIVEANLRLLVSIAKKFANNSQHFEELLSEGHVTLIKAVEKFDYSRGFRFSTYVTHAIWRAYYRAGKKAVHQPISLNPNPGFPELEIPDFRSSDETPGGQSQAIQTLYQLMDEVLDDRERAILIARYGIGRDGTSMTLRDIGSQLELSKERIRQLQVRAIEKLKTAGASLWMLFDETFDAPRVEPISENALS